MIWWAVLGCPRKPLHCCGCVEAGGSRTRCKSLSTKLMRPLGTFENGSIWGCEEINFSAELIWHRNLYREKIWPLPKKQMWNQRNGRKTHLIAQVVAQSLCPECDEVLWNITNQHKRIILQMIHQRPAHPFDSITELFSSLIVNYPIWFIGWTYSDIINLLQTPWVRVNE